MKNLFENYNRKISKQEIIKNVTTIKNESKKIYNTEILKKAFSFIDLTFLNSTDNKDKITQIIKQVNNFSATYPQIPNVAAICIFPNYIETIKKDLKVKGIKIASVVGGFPASQTFLEIKTKESRLAVQRGANETDMVISIGEFLNKEYQLVQLEIIKIRHAIKGATLKVIIETGVLQDFQRIYNASLLAMESGADFVKTSTGKEKIGATPEAVYVMALAIKDYFKKTGKKVGIKPAGGVSSGETAIFYMSIIEKILGKEWLKPELFRFGSSSLANKLLKEIEPNKKDYFGLSSEY